MHYWSCNLLDCTTSWYNGSLSIQFLMLWTRDVDGNTFSLFLILTLKSWKAAIVFSGNNSVSLIDVHGGSSCWFGLFFWRDFLSIASAGTTFCLWNSSELRTRVSSWTQTQYGQCCLHALKQDEANQCAEISPRTMAFNCLLLRAIQEQPAPPCNTRSNDFNNASLYATNIHHRCRWPCL